MTLCAVKKTKVEKIEKPTSNLMHHGNTSTNVRLQYNLFQNRFTVIDGEHT